MMVWFDLDGKNVCLVRFKADAEDPSKATINGMMMQERAGTGYRNSGNVDKTKWGEMLDMLHISAHINALASVARLLRGEDDRNPDIPLTTEDIIQQPLVIVR